MVRNNRAIDEYIRNQTISTALLLTFPFIDISSLHKMRDCPKITTIEWYITTALHVVMK